MHYKSHVLLFLGKYRLLSVSWSSDDEPDCQKNNDYSNVRSALLLVNVVADSRFELYDAFQNPYGNRLPEYLQCINDAFIEGLNANGSDPFRVLAM